MSIHIDAYSDASAFLALEPVWDDLAERSETNTPFQRNEFQRLWWHHFGEGELRVLAARNEQGELVGLATVYFDTNDVLRWLGGEDIADYLDVIAPSHDIQSVREAVFSWLTGPEAPSWKRAQLSNIPEWSDTPNHWISLSEKLGWDSEVTALDVCPTVQLPSSFDDYLASLDGRQRREIRRKLRRAEASNARWYIVNEADEMEAASQAFIELMVASSREKAAFLTPKMRNAFSDIFVRANAAGWFQLCFLEVEGHKVAGYAYFSLDDTLYLYNSGYDLALYGTLSPGWVLLAHLFQHAIESGHKVFDFMQGNEDYKYKFGGQDVEVLQLTIATC